MLSDTEAHIGRWDADGGIFPDIDLDTDDPEAKVSRRHARITLSNGQYFLKIWDRRTVRLSIVASDCPRDSARHSATATKSSSAKLFCASTL